MATHYEKLVRYLRDNALITLERLPEHISIRGNLMASGDDKLDKEMEDATIEDYNNGNEWAWCCVCVKATYSSIEQSEYLGGCSYRSKADFKADGYYEDMVTNVLEALANELTRIHGHVLKAIE